MATTTSRNKHTPGPWEFDPTGRYYNHNVIRHNGMLVCEMHSIRVPGYSLEADAAIIAAAPDLLEALRKLTKRASKAGVLWAEIDAAQVALLKAEGRT